MNELIARPFSADYSPYSALGRRLPVAARLWSYRAERPLFVAGTLVTVGWFLTFPFVWLWLASNGVPPNYDYWDFRVYIITLEQWSSGNSIYYSPTDGRYHGSWLYLPIFLFLFRPLVSAFGAGLAPVIWAILTVFILWIGLQLVITELGHNLTIWERGGLLWMMLGFHPLLVAVGSGQTSAFLTAMLCFSFVALSRAERDGDVRWLILSGGLTGFVGTFKLAYAPVGAHLLRSRYRMFGAIVAGVSLVGLSIFLFGFDVHMRYLDVLRWGLERANDTRVPVPWWPSYFRPLTWVDDANLIRGILSLIVVVVAVGAERGQESEIFALGVIAAPLLVPLGYTYYLVAALPAFLIILSSQLEEGGRPGVAVLGIALINLHSYGMKILIPLTGRLVRSTFLHLPYEPTVYLLHPDCGVASSYSVSLLSALNQRDALNNSNKCTSGGGGTSSPI